MFNVTPVRMHELVDGMAQELAYDPEMFDYGKPLEVETPPASETVDARDVPGFTTN